MGQRYYLVEFSISDYTHQVSIGWNVAIQANAVIAAQAGFHSYSYPEGTFGELGVGFPSGSVIAIYIFKPVLDLW